METENKKINQDTTTNVRDPKKFAELIDVIHAKIIDLDKDLRELKPYVSETFYKAKVSVCMSRIEKFDESLVELSPRAKILLAKVPNLIKNPEMLKRMEELAEEAEKQNKEESKKQV